MVMRRLLLSLYFLFKTMFCDCNTALLTVLSSLPVRSPTQRKIDATNAKISQLINMRKNIIGLYKKDDNPSGEAMKKRDLDETEAALYKQIDVELDEIWETDGDQLTSGEERSLSLGELELGLYFKDKRL